ncbi:MAG: hypothetical protein NC421_10695 [Lachnospiraceae bacterium]|nr:hypothetical protein [Lachnospiraceae bacterium]
MKKFLKILGILVLVISLASCSKEEQHEDRIVTDLNEIFDPEDETYTDWNHTEVDEDLMEAFGLYYDYDIKAFRQKYEYYAKNDKNHEKRKSREPLNPIKGHLIMMVLLLVAGEGYLLYATYVQAKKLHRIVWIWMVNCIMGGGLASFIVLSLSSPLEFDKDLDIRQEPDLLGTAMFVVNLFVILIIAVGVNLYINMLRNPKIVTDFFN